MKIENFIALMLINLFHQRIPETSTLQFCDIVADREIRIGRKYLDKASELTEVMIKKYDQNPQVSTLKYIWNGFIENNELEKLKINGNILSMVFFVSRIVRSNEFFNFVSISQKTKMLLDLFIIII